MNGYHTLKELTEQGESLGLPLWEVIWKTDAAERMTAEAETFETMRSMYHAMQIADRQYDGSLRSAAGLSGGDGEKLAVYNQAERNLCGPYLSLVMEKALKMGESNACMKRIVAAPTAGSCGVIPAVFLSYEQLYQPDEDSMVQAMFLTAGIGAVIAENASIAGAEGGCQAEIGSASAMAAAGLAFLQGGNADCIVHAAALALKSMLGLACDPVCGLVEVPCIKRNVAGAVNAVSAAQMALAGIRSRIAPDDVIEAMRRIGSHMPEDIRETGLGGLAGTESALAIQKKLKTAE